MLLIENTRRGYSFSLLKYTKEQKNKNIRKKRYTGVM